MKIVFIGTVDFSKKILQKLIDINAQVVGVCTKENSEFNSDFANLAYLCKDYQIPCKYVNDINSKDSINWIKSLKPDIIFCFGWSNLIKKELLSLPPMGVLGYHPAKLPANRGRHPLIWSIVLGLTQSASTFFFLDESADSGDIISQNDFEILSTDDAQALYNKVTDIALIQIEELLQKLINNTYERIKQNDKLASNWRKRIKKDGKIDFRMSSEAIYNLIRGLTRPYVGAHLEYQNKDIKVWKAGMIENNQDNIECGKVLDTYQNMILVKTYDGSIEILEHEFHELPMVGEYL